MERRAEEGEVALLSDAEEEEESERKWEPAAAYHASSIAEVERKGEVSRSVRQ